MEVDLLKSQGRQHLADQADQAGPPPLGSGHRRTASGVKGCGPLCIKPSTRVPALSGFYRRLVDLRFSRYICSPQIEAGYFGNMKTYKAVEIQALLNVPSARELYA